MTREEVLRATVAAPIGVHLVRPDSEVIEREGWYQIITPSCRHSFLNEVIFSKTPPGEADRAIAEVIDQYRSRGLPFKWCVGPWTEPPDLGARLSRLGFVDWGVKGMAIDPRRFETGVPSGVSVESVSPKNAEEFIDTYLQGWEFRESERPATERSLIAAIRAESSPKEFFLARYQGHAAGTASIFFREGSAYLTGGNVLPEFRKRGVYLGLISERLRILRERSIFLATTHARAHTSAPILEKIGFETVFESRVYHTP